MSCTAEFFFGMADGKTLEGFQGPIGTIVIMERYNELNNEYDVHIYRATLNTGNDGHPVNLILKRIVSGQQGESVQVSASDLE